MNDYSHLNQTQKTQELGKVFAETVQPAFLKYLNDFISEVHPLPLNKVVLPEIRENPPHKHQKEEFEFALITDLEAAGFKGTEIKLHPMGKDFWVYPPGILPFRRSDGEIPDTLFGLSVAVLIYQQIQYKFADENREWLRELDKIYGNFSVTFPKSILHEDDVSVELVLGNQIPTFMQIINFMMHENVKDRAEVLRIFERMKTEVPNLDFDGGYFQRHGLTHIQALSRTTSGLWTELGPSYIYLPNLVRSNDSELIDPRFYKFLWLTANPNSKSYGYLDGFHGGCPVNHGSTIPDTFQAYIDVFKLITPEIIATLRRY